MFENDEKSAPVTFAQAKAAWQDLTRAEFNIARLSAYPRMSRQMHRDLGKYRGIAAESRLILTRYFNQQV